MSKIGGNRNFGWGKQLTWAGKQALRQTFGNGNFGTVASHSHRWKLFVDWLREHGIRDARDVRQEALDAYGEDLAQRVREGVSTSYAQNLLSSVNVTLEALRGDRAIRVRPADVVGRRVTVRMTVPPGLDRSVFTAAQHSLRKAGNDRVAACVRLCRELGLRRREASLMNLRRALGQARRLGRVNVTEGTKGGRGRAVDRWVPVSALAFAALSISKEVAGRTNKLVPPNLELRQWLPRLTRGWRIAAKEHGLGNVRDLRAAFACDRYRQLTGAAAPVVQGARCVSKEADRNARRVLAIELGHNRVDVLSAYIGSAR